MYLSDVNITRLPKSVGGVLRKGGRPAAVSVVIKNEQDGLADGAIPKVTIVKGRRLYRG